MHRVAGAPSIVVCAGEYEKLYYETGGCYSGLATDGQGTWERKSSFFRATSAMATVYINQESTKFDSWLDGIVLQKAAEYSLGCTASWSTSNAEVACDTIGGRSDVLRLKDAGGWSHGHVTLPVEPGAVYELKAELYAESLGECDSGAAVKW